MNETGFDQMNFIVGLRSKAVLVSGFNCSRGKIVSMILLPLNRTVSLKVLLSNIRIIEEIIRYGAISNGTSESTVNVGELLRGIYFAF